MSDMPKVGDIVFLWWLNRDGDITDGLGVRVTAVYEDGAIDGVDWDGIWDSSKWDRCPALGTAEARERHLGWEVVPVDLREQIEQDKVRLGAVKEDLRAAWAAYRAQRERHDRTDTVLSVRRKMLDVLVAGWDNVVRENSDDE